MHAVLDAIQGVNADLANKFHPVMASIGLSAVGILTGLHITSVVCSIAYTAFCAFLKHREHKHNLKNQNNEKKP